MNRTIKSALMRFMALILLTLGTASASAQYYMNIQKKDGTRIQYIVTDLDSVWFTGSAVSTHEYVDLGLPSGLLWATCNVGADNPWDYGEYFAWGETEPKANYSDNNYKFYKSDTSSTDDIEYTKYDYRYDSRLDPIDDVAHVQWGGNWRLPTQDEFNELIYYCRWEWETVNGINGYRVTGYHGGGSIFLPASGFISDSIVSQKNNSGVYMSEDLQNDRYYTGVSSLAFVKGNRDIILYPRTFGLSARPVCPSDEWLEHTKISLNTDSATIIKGGICKLIPNVVFADSDKPYYGFEWKSDNPSVAEVDQDGIVHAKSCGIAHVTVSLYTLSVQCIVTVIDESVIEPEYVDLGLSVKWASFNLGASSPEQFGHYYAWGETETKDIYSWSTYKWRDEKSSRIKMKKYFQDTGHWPIEDGKTLLDLEDDVAHVKWGGDWRMPNHSEFNELLFNCAWSWTTINGTSGYLVTSNLSGYEDNSIFLPASGFIDSTSFCNENYGSTSKDPWGFYWTSSLGYISEQDHVECLGIKEGSSAPGGLVLFSGYYGLPVRPVCTSDEWLSHINLVLNTDSITLAPDGLSQLYVNVKYDGENYSYYGFEWSSDSPSVASVNSDGIITALSKGTAHITVSLRSVSVQCTVTVIDDSDVKPECVDLGLSVKWATFNVGAFLPEQYGGYYSWGETNTKEKYFGYNYKWHSMPGYSLSKYNTDPKNGNVDNRITLEPEDDIAHVRWGFNWRMPTDAEIDELINHCKWIWTSENGVDGYKINSLIPGYEENSIFLPSAGYRSGPYLWNTNYAYYWSSSLDTDDHSLISVIYFSPSEINKSSFGRSLGMPVRPVCPSEEWISHLSLSLSDTSITMIPDEVCNIMTELKYDNDIYSYIADFEWTSDNPSVATVDENGKVTAISKGTANIIVNWRTLSTMCKITVLDKSFIVDLGLSVMWATCNVGATKPEEYGDTFAWGETEPKSEYNWSTYKWSNGSANTLTKYCNNSDYGNEGFTDTKTTLDLEDDVAHVKWGGNWRMPTQAEQEELFNNCTWKWYSKGNTEFNGVAGYKVTSNKEGYTDRFIFLPNDGANWSSSLDTENPDNAWAFFRLPFAPYRYVHYGSERNCDHPVRPVCPSAEWLTSVSISFVENDKTLLVNASAVLNVVVKNNDDILDRSFVVWSSDNPSVAVVNDKGVVSAISTGTAHITASVQSKTVQCTITVINDESEHECVDLGLSVKWATFNVGALSPEDFGSYYAWGETEPKYSYTWDNYKFRTSGDSWDNVKFSKYNTLSSYGKVDNKATLDLEDDVAHVKWGGNWRIPTWVEQYELFNNCTWTWYSSGNTEFNGVAGYKVTSNIKGYTDRFIFLPAAGYRSDTNSNYAGDSGYYWTNLLYEGSPSNVNVLRMLFSYNRSEYGYSNSKRYSGNSVRPVCPSEDWLSHISISLDNNTMSLIQGGIGHLKVITKYDGNDYSFANAGFVWSSDNKTVAVVDENGNVTAMSNGTACITVSLGSESIQCKITVIDESVIEHEYVDLGLSVKWATFNVGASKPEEYGGFYSWGETEHKTDYSWSKYKWCNGSESSLTKYCSNSFYSNEGFADTLKVLAPEDDVAHVKWGGSWRMPTLAEQEELRNNCTWTPYDSGNTEFNGVAGYKVTSKIEGYTDRSIFLPAAGYRDGTAFSFVGSDGLYWSSSLDTENPCKAWHIYFSSSPGYKYVNKNNFDRRNGYSIRPVCP